MVKSIKIGNLSIKGVFRHKWEDPNEHRWEKREWKRKEIGIFFQKHLCVGTDKKGKEMFSCDNLKPTYMFGVRFIWFKMWIEISWKVLHLK
jgi:hypothetical protein